MRHFAVQMHYNGDDGSACVDLRLFDACNGYWVGPKLTVRMFLLLRLCSNLVLLLAFDAVGVVSSPSSCVAQIHYNGAGDSVLIFVYRTGIDPEQTGRTFVLLPACTLELERVSGFQCSMGLLFYLSHAISKYTTMAMTTLR